MTNSVFSKLGKSAAPATDQERPPEHERERKSVAPAAAKPAAVPSSENAGQKTSIYPSPALLQRVAAYGKTDVDLGRGYSKADVLLRLALLGAAVLELSGRDDVPEKTEISDFARSIVSL
jgi:hypothetical protein